MNKKYLSNYYYLHPKGKEKVVVERGKGKKVQEKKDEWTKMVEEVATQSEPLLQKVPQQQEPKVILLPQDKCTQTVEQIHTQTSTEFPRQQQPPPPIPPTTNPNPNPDTQTPHPISLPTPIKPLPTKPTLLLSLLTQLSYCMHSLELKKNSLTHIPYKCIFEFIGSQGWQWISEEQWAKGIARLGIECQEYQVEMLWRRLVQNGELLEYEGFVRGVMRPLFGRGEQGRRYVGREVIKGDKEGRVREVFRKALEVEYYVYLVKEIMASEGWTCQAVIKILRQDKLVLVGQTCQLEDLENVLASCSKQQCTLLFTYLANEESNLITASSLKAFLLEP